MILASTAGQIFQPFFDLVGYVLAFLYSLVHNYAIAIVLLTLLFMAVTAPLTAKSTRSMLHMQRLQPEMKKLQAKYKDDKAKLQEELMAFYKREGFNPASGCVPMLLQWPVFLLLYQVIYGLTATAVKHGKYLPGPGCWRSGHLEVTCSTPRYVPNPSLIRQDILAAHSKLVSFGLNLADRATSHHSSFLAALPFWVLVVMAVGAIYASMAQLNRFYTNAGITGMKQTVMMNRVMTLVMAVIYVAIPAGVTIYFIVSGLARVAIQVPVLRAEPKRMERRKEQAAARDRDGAAGKGRPGLMERLFEAQKNAAERARDLESKKEEAIREAIDSAGPSRERNRGPASDPKNAQEWAGIPDNNGSNSERPMKKQPTPNGAGGTQKGSSSRRPGSKKARRRK